MTNLALHQKQTNKLLDQLEIKAVELKELKTNLNRQESQYNELHIALATHYEYPDAWQITITKHRSPCSHNKPRIDKILINTSSRAKGLVHNREISYDYADRYDPEHPLYDMASYFEDELYLGQAWDQLAQPDGSYSLLIKDALQEALENI